MYGAISFEHLTSGMGMGAFGVLLLRMTQKRFSATQYALFSSLFGLPRIVAGPITGFVVHALGWEAFFWLTLLAGIPGMLLLQRFVPLGVREPTFTVRPPTTLDPLSTGALAARGIASGGLAFALGGVASALLTALGTVRRNPGEPVSLSGPLAALFQPADAQAWLTLAGLLIFALVVGLCIAAISAARHGAATDLGDDESPA
jgi:PAT family beta-lactamase induction signal transducer AmpG